MRGLLIVVLALFCASLRAEPEENLRTFYAGVSALAADFEQRLLDEDGETLERYAGRLWLQRPGRFLWLYDTPYNLELGSDGERLWHYDVDLRQVTVRDAASSLSGSPAELLGGDLSQLEQFDIQRLPDAEQLEWLRLRPRSADSDFSQIDIGLLRQGPQRILLKDRLGQTTVIELHDLQVNPQLDSRRFQMQVPDHVTIVDERADS